MSGDDGDDLMIWNPGDGSDKMEGGAGNDTAQDNGGAGNEHFIVSAQGQRVTATRDNAAPFFLDIGTTETLDLNTNAGDDAVEIENGIGTLIKVDANLGDGNDPIEAATTRADIIDGARRHRHRRGRRDRPGHQRREIGGRRRRRKPKVEIKSKKLKVKNGKAAVKVSCPAGESVLRRQDHDQAQRQGRRLDQDQARRRADEDLPGAAQAHDAHRARPGRRRRLAARSKRHARSDAAERRAAHERAELDLKGGHSLRDSRTRRQRPASWPAASPAVPGCAAPPRDAARGRSSRSPASISSPCTSEIFLPGAKCASAWRPSGITTRGRISASCCSSHGM